MQNEKANPKIDFLRETLEMAVAADLMDQARLKGAVISEAVKAQANMLAQLATRAILRRINIVQLTTEQPKIDIAKYDKAGKERGVTFFDDVVLPEIADGVAKVLRENAFMAITEEDKGTKMHWHTQLFIVPPNAFEVPVPPPEQKKASPLILPPGMRR